MRQVLIVACGFLIGCSSPPKPEHVAYVNQAFDSIRVRSIRQDFNFDSLEQDVLSRLEGDHEIKKVYALLSIALVQIDKHSFLATPEKNKLALNGGEEAVPEPYPFSGKIIKEKYAYVDLLPFPGIDSVSADNYVDSLQRLLHLLYEQQPAGWIIDLRTNLGGNPYAMTGGMGALLGEGTLVSSVSHGGETHDHFYMRTDDSGEIEKLELVDSAYVFEKKLPIVVFVGAETGSAAEVLTLAFKGLENAIILGKPTFGVSTGLHPVYMPDSSCLFITNSIGRDRFGNAYDGPIEPDELIEDPLGIFDRAYEYINGSGVN